MESVDAPAVEAQERSLFWRLVRFRSTPDRDPREDSLTEVFAAVLERVPGLALHLARCWLDPRDDRAGACEVTSPATAAPFAALETVADDAIGTVATQVHTSGVGRVDVELRLATATGAAGEVLIRVEVKHGAKPERKQLERYLTATSATHLAVVLLAPREGLLAFDPEQLPEGIAQRTWQATARHIAAFEPRDRLHVWLIDQLTRFLREEQLIDPRVLLDEHFAALTHIREANIGLAAICQHADALLQRQLGAAESAPRRAHGIGHRSAWTPADDLPATFEWGVAESNTAVDMPFVHLFAGVSVPKGTVLDAEWLRALKDGVPGGGDDDELVVFRFWPGDTADRLMRLASPRAVLEECDSLEAQGARLASWVMEAYQALDDLVG